MTHMELCAAIEDLVDKTDIVEVIAALDCVCEEKAEYVAEGGSHGDPSAFLAREWRAVGKMLNKAARRAEETFK